MFVLAFLKLKPSGIAPVVLALLVAVVAPSANAQNWAAFTQHDTAFYAVEFTAGQTEYHALAMDSVSMANNDSVFFHYRQIHNLGYPHGGRWSDPAEVATVGRSSWAGTSAVKHGNEWYGFGALTSDTVWINSHASVGESWVLYNDAAYSISASVNSITYEPVLGQLDSVKTIGLTVYNATMIPIPSHPLNDMELQLSKSFGLVVACNFLHFPNEHLPYQLAGTTRSSLGLQPLDATQVFAQQVGDQFSYDFAEYYMNNLLNSANYRDRIAAISTSVNNDTVHFEFSRLQNSDSSYLSKTIVLSEHEWLGQLPYQVFSSDATYLGHAPVTSDTLWSYTIHRYWDQPCTAGRYVSHGNWHNRSGNSATVATEGAVPGQRFLKRLGGPLHIDPSSSNLSWHTLYHYALSTGEACGTPTDYWPVLVQSSNANAAAPTIWLRPDGSIVVEQPGQNPLEILEIYNAAGQLICRSRMIPSHGTIELRTTLPYSQLLYYRGLSMGAVFTGKVQRQE